MKNKLSLGPVLFNWSREKRLDFYYKIADEAAVDIVYLGEVVCDKRLKFFKDDLPKITERLKAAGKQVIYSTLALLHTEKELAVMRELISEYDGLIEANDTSALFLLNNKDHCIGPYINIYNELALAFHEKNGAIRVTLPPELAADSIKSIAAKSNIDLEVQVFGRKPLAISARCAHARAYNSQKKGCKTICDKDPDGLNVYTLEKQPFLTVNGLQTLSHTYSNLITELDDLAAMNISTFRISPHDIDMTFVINCYRDIMDERYSSVEGAEKITNKFSNINFSNGFYFAEPGCDLVTAKTANQQAE